jgi:hypothetical protein
LVVSVAPGGRRQLAQADGHIAAPFAVARRSGAGIKIDRAAARLGEESPRAHDTGKEKSPAGAGLKSRHTLLKRDAFYSNRHHALAFCLSMIFFENRYPLFGIMP